MDGSLCKSPCCEKGGCEHKALASTPCGSGCGALFPRCGGLYRITEDGDADDEVEMDGQAHVFTFFHELTHEQKHKLEFDFDHVEDCFFHHNFLLQSLKHIEDQKDLDYKQPKIMEWNRKKLPSLQSGANITDLDNIEGFRQHMWRSWGCDMYANGKVAIVILHGGLDAGLGENMPKGTLDIGLLSHKSILQLYFERIKRLQHLIARKIKEEKKRAEAMIVINAKQGRIKEDDPDHDPDDHAAKQKADDDEQRLKHMIEMQKEKEDALRAELKEMDAHHLLKRAHHMGVPQFEIDEAANKPDIDSKKATLLEFIMAKATSEENIDIPVYVMCNSENHALLEEFLHENKFFGLKENSVMLFEQGNAPLLDLKGRLLLHDKDQIAQEPCGNGYLFKALSQDGLCADMKTRCVTSLLVYSADNVIAKIGDPLFLGFCKQCDAEAGVKCIRKERIDEPHGVYLSKKMKIHEDVDGDGKADIVARKLRACVVEHREMPDFVMTDTVDNKVVYDCANTSQYFFKLDFFARMSHHHHNKEQARWHPILKAKPRINLSTGELMVPTHGEKNAYRLEQFLFDVFEHSNAVAGLKVPRSELAVVKKLTGPYSPAFAVLAISKLHQAWILEAGAEFAGKKLATEREDGKCEISPLVSYDGEDLKGQFWMPIELPFYLPSKEESEDFTVAHLEHDHRHSLHFIDWDGELAKQNLEQELQFALDKVMDTTLDHEEGEDYCGEFLDKDDSARLPPTPDDHYEFDESGLSNTQRSLSARKSNRDNTRRASLIVSDTPLADWLLGPREAETKSEAIVGSPELYRRRLEMKETGQVVTASLLKGLDTRKRFASARRQGESARSGGASGRAQSVGMLGQSARGEIIANAARDQRISLRCVPPRRQGLEISEFGVRQAMGRAGDAPWWDKNRALEEQNQTKAGVVVPQGLECVVS